MKRLGDDLISITFNVPKDLFDEIKKEAIDKDLSISQLMRNMVKDRFDAEN